MMVVIPFNQQLGIETPLQYTVKSAIKILFADRPDNGFSTDHKFLAFDFLKKSFMTLLSPDPEKMTAKSLHEDTDSSASVPDTVTIKDKEAILLKTKQRYQTEAGPFCL
jgi:hypothetical protein